MKIVELREIDLNVAEILSREQMKDIGGGGLSGVGSGIDGGSCSTSSCSLFDGTTTFNGHCSTTYTNWNGSGTVSGQCGCSTVMGSYTPIRGDGTSNCAN